MTTPARPHHARTNGDGAFLSGATPWRDTTRPTQRPGHNYRRHPCGCYRQDVEIVTRNNGHPNGAPTEIVHRLIGAHDPNSPHPAAVSVRARATDTWPGRP